MATQTSDAVLSDLIVREWDPRYNRELKTFDTTGYAGYAGAGQNFEIGTCINSSGSPIDDTEEGNIAAIIIERVEDTAVDTAVTNVNCLVRGPAIVRKSQLVAANDAAADIDAIITQLKTLDIVVVDTPAKVAVAT